MESYVYAEVLTTAAAMGQDTLAPMYTHEGKTYVEAEGGVVFKVRAHNRWHRPLYFGLDVDGVKTKRGSNLVKPGASHVFDKFVKIDGKKKMTYNLEFGNVAIASEMDPESGASAAAAAAAARRR